MDARSTNPIGLQDRQPRGRAAIRVMIVDDSLMVRTAFSRMIAGAHGLEVVATAASAERALETLRDIRVDVVLLDLEMPGMGGLEALPRILARARNTHVLVVSSLTQAGAEHTLAALAMGAADTMLKPQSGGFDEDYRASLLQKVRALGGQPVEAGSPAALAPPSLTARNRLLRKRPEAIAIGASTGGIHALGILLRALPEDFDCPLLITQHLPASFMPVFARQVETAAARRTILAQDGAIVRRGEVLVATGQGHMTLSRRGEDLVTAVCARPAPSGCTPSVDPMLTSLAQATDGHALGIILSGMGRDGVQGARALVEAGGTILAQDAKSSAVWGMPGAVARDGLASAVLPPDELARAAVEATGASAWR